MGTIFSELLVKLRKDAGFATAYRFFHDNGGKPVLNFSYRKYLLWEQGKTLPPVNSIARLTTALQLPPESGPLGGFVASWLKTMAGPEAYNEVFKPFIAAREDTPGMSPLHKAMNRVLNDKKYPISVEKAVVILATCEHYKAFLFITNDSGVWSEEILAKTIEIGKGAASKIVQDFLRIGLLKKERSGLLKCHLLGCMVEFPRAEIMPAGYGDRMGRYQKEMLDSGVGVWRRLGFIRADSRELSGFFPMMNLNVSTAHTYSITEKTEHSAMFGVEGRVVKLRDF
jgi:hypothetical protein